MLEAWLYKRGVALLGVHERAVVHGCVQAWHSTGASGGLKSFEALYPSFRVLANRPWHLPKALSELVRQQHGLVNFMDKLRYQIVPQAAEVRRGRSCPVRAT